MKLQKFIITKLNGYQNVEIHIENNRKILVAENGSGKTTILNILFCCLTNNTSKLKGFTFEKAELIFSNGKVTRFYKDDLEQKYNENFDDIWDSYSRLKPSDYFLINEKLNSFFEFVNFILEYSGYIDVEKFIGFYIHKIFDVNSDYSKKRFIQNYIVKNLNFDAAGMLIDIDKLILSKSDLYKIYFYLRSGEFEIYNRKMHVRGRLDRNRFSREVLDFLMRELEFRISEIKNLKRCEYYNPKISTIFLPTYRRIENDSSEILGDFKVKEDSHISFGIKDVVTLYSDIFKKIKDYSVEAFSKINNKIIEQYMGESIDIDKSKLENYTVGDIRLILGRIGNGIDEKNKERILQKYGSDGGDSNYINLLLINMIDIYEKQKKVENEIIKYTTVCNNYLVGKTIKYCPENMKIQLFQNGKELSFNVFSSGEKQIVSLFAKLYLLPLNDLDWSNDSKLLDNLTNKKFWIIFDEPELSLSVEWQKNLLPDILESNRCEFLFVTTHSPFIFKNDLKFSTSDIRNYVSEF